jgi:hypothetical protein
LDIAGRNNIVSGKEYLNFIFYRRVNRILSFYKFN